MKKFEKNELNFQIPMTLRRHVWPQPCALRCVLALDLQRVVRSELRCRKNLWVRQICTVRHRCETMRRWILFGYAKYESIRRFNSKKSIPLVCRQRRFVSKQSGQSSSQDPLKRLNCFGYSFDFRSGQILDDSRLKYLIFECIAFLSLTKLRTLHLDCF